MPRRVEAQPRCVLDAEGCLWNARWDGGCVARFTPNGRLDSLVDLPVSRPTSYAFGGKDLDILYITSAAIGLSGGDLAAQPLAGGLFAIEVGVAGLREAAFAGQHRPRALDPRQTTLSSRIGRLATMRS